MNSKEEILDFLHKNYEAITKKYHLTKLGMFGSFARDEQNTNSDVDIIIEIEDGTQNIYDLKSSLRTYLTRSFDRSVDIAREKYLKPYVKEIILKDTIYVK